MKSFVKSILLLFCLNLSPLAAEMSIELRGAAFSHASGLFRDIYASSSSCFEIEASTPFSCCIDGWVNFDGFQKRGTSRGLRNATRVTIANTSVGIKYVWQLNHCLLGYAGIGPSFSWICLKNKYHDCPEKKSKFAVGGIVKVGFDYYFYDRFFLDLFIDYLYQPVQFHSTEDIGGLKVGAGLGVTF